MSANIITFPSLRFDAERRAAIVEELHEEHRYDVAVPCPVVGCGAGAFERCRWSLRVGQRAARDYTHIRRRRLWRDLNRVQRLVCAALYDLHEESTNGMEER